MDAKTEKLQLQRLLRKAERMNERLAELDARGDALERLIEKRLPSPRPTLRVIDGDG